MTNLVLVPGLLCTEALFSRQTIDLADAAHVSVANHTRHDRIAAIAEDVLSSAPETFVLGGLSMGGYIALEIVRRAPNRVRGLILMDTNARADRDAQKADRQRTIDIAHEKGLDPVLDAFVPMMVHPGRLGDTDLIDTIRAMGARTGVDVYIRQQTAIMERRDNREFLAEITCPTLVIVGAQDLITPVKVAQEMVDGVSGARLEIVSDCGHLPTLEKPDVVTGLMRTFVGNV